MANVTEGFAQRLKELRKQREFSQTELGKRASLHYTHIGRYEKGAAFPSGETLQRLAEALGVSADYLLEGSMNTVAQARFQDKELLKQFQEVEGLPNEDKEVVKKLLEAFLIRRQIQALTR
jgi:transcriptional regulator with XRE-family HTH domain